MSATRPPAGKPAGRYGNIMMKRIDAVLGRVTAGMAFLSGVCTLVIMLVMVSDVLYRPTGNGSIRGAYELVTVLLVLVVFLGLPYAERSETNVRVTLLTSRLPRPVARLTRLFGGVVSFGVVCWFAQATWTNALTSFSRGEFTSGIVEFPVWPSRLIIAAGFTVLALECLMGIWRRWSADHHEGEPAVQSTFATIQNGSPV